MRPATSIIPEFIDDFAYSSLFLLLSGETSLFLNHHSVDWLAPCSAFSWAIQKRSEKRKFSLVLLSGSLSGFFTL